MVKLDNKADGIQEEDEEVFLKEDGVVSLELEEPQDLDLAVELKDNLFNTLTPELWVSSS